MSTRSKQLVMKLGPDDSVLRLELPAPSTRLLEGVRWGRYDETFTPAFWATRLWIDADESVTAARPVYQLGQTLAEEVVACMLGGFGMPAEVGLAAFRRLQARGLIHGKVSEEDLQAALLEALDVDGRKVRYRYPMQKARFIASALNRLSSEVAPVDEVEFRDWLLTFTGIGPKTASWITRNWLRSDQVAILDVHLHRAGLLMGLFSAEESIAKHYRQMERKLVKFAAALGVRLSELDDLVWRYMKHWNHHAIGHLETRAGGR